MTDPLRKAVLACGRVVPESDRISITGGVAHMIEPSISKRIQETAIGLLSDTQRRKVSLYIDETPVDPGTVLGPLFQRIRVTRESVLVFVDDNPFANFGHECRYLLFDPRSGELQRAHYARFPPYLHGLPPTYRSFFEPSAPSHDVERPGATCDSPVISEKQE
jgi:hypothetical protein